VSPSSPGYEPPWIEWNPLIPAAKHVMEHWPEYLDALQSPVTYAGVAAAGGLAYGAALGARRAARYVGSEPGDVFLGRRIQTARDAFLKRLVIAHWPDRTHHYELVGPTGSGKTTALLPMAVQDLLNGHTVVTEEIYGDFGTTLIPYAIAMGRPFLIFDPSIDGSLRWNPLAGEDDDVVGDFSSTVEGLFRNNHEFYGAFNGDAARAFARLAREYARRVGGEADLALFGLLLTDRAFLYRVLNVKVDAEGYQKNQTVGAPWVGRETRSWFDSEYLRWSDKLRVDYLASLKNWVRKLLQTKAARRALCPRPNDLTLDLDAALSMGGVLVVLRSPVTAVKEEPARAIVRFLTKSIQDLTLRRRESYWPVPPLALYLDELPTLVGRDFGDAMSAAQWMALVRKQNVSVTVAHQGGALIGDVLAGAVDTNARSTLFAGGLGAEDLLRAQRAAGYEEKEVHDERVTRTAPLNPMASSYSRGTRTQKGPRFGEEEMRFSKIGEWVHIPFRDRRQHPAERVRVERVPPPEAFAGRGLRGRVV
jgi:hypothetical protein